MTYKVELIHSDEGYAVDCPELPGCHSQGETKEEAIENIRDAISEYLLVAPPDKTPKEICFVEVTDKAAHSGLDRTPFKVTPIFAGLPPEWTSHKIDDLLDILEGSDRRW